VTFATTAVQSYNSTISFTAASSGGGANTNGSFTVTGNGTSAAAPVASLSPNPLVFSKVSVGTYSIGTATLSNTGNAPLNNIAVSFTGSGASAFTTYPLSTCGTTLAAGDSCTYVIHFQPSAAGGYAATLSVSDSAIGTPQTITLSGIGTPAPAAEVQFTPTILSAIAGTAPANCVSPAEPGPALQTQLCGPTAVAVDYSGNIYIAEQSANVVKKLANNGTVTTFAGVEGAAGSYGGDNGPASAAQLNAPLGLAVDGLGNVYISDSGNGRIREVNATTNTITTFVGGGNSTYFNGGTGTTAAAPVALLSPTTLSLGSVATGTTTSAQVLTLSNTGNAALAVSGITIGGANASDFAETTTCGTTLAVEASCTISVTFTPSSVASFAATISVADSAAGSPQIASLSGSGIAAPDFTVSVSPAAVTAGEESGVSTPTIQTAALTAENQGLGGWPRVPGAVVAFCLPLLWWRCRDQLRRMGTGLLCVLLSLGAAALTGCGGGYYSKSPAQTYSIKVTGTSGSTQHSTTVTLTVQ
jgi:hypothetical protein